jgi:8-oxo-dGTP pyrophosphatase MutT (NUDIX family)
LKALVWILRPAARGPEVLLLQRPERRGGGWHPVTGKGDKGEDITATATREAFEETGLRGVLEELGLRHQFAGNRRDFEEHAFWLRVEEGAAPRLSDEHVAHRWADPDEALAAVQWPNHRAALALALERWR